MKPIKETHPSLSHKYGDILMVVQDLQEHTIDKTVLREILSRKRETPFQRTEASEDLKSQIIEDIWKLLEKEE